MIMATLKNRFNRFLVNIMSEMAGDQKLDNSDHDDGLGSQTGSEPVWYFKSFVISLTLFMCIYLLQVGIIRCIYMYNDFVYIW